MSVLLDPANRTRKGTQRLIVHTVAMFSLFTIDVAMSLGNHLVSYIGNREFPGADGERPLGPYGYEILRYTNALNVVPDVMPLSNQWLANGILIRLC